MEITRKNFNEQFDNITKDLKKSCFASFDAEFTAIIAGECFKHRLFDTNEERYDRIKNEVSKMIMTQVGLTFFQYDRDHDTYVATGYTFHLCPQVVGDIDQSFIFQASTLNFLCRHNFDFNKFTYEGLPYLSKAEEAKVRKMLKEGSNYLLRTLEMTDEKLLQQYCSEVAKWLATSKEGTLYLDIENPLLRYIVHNEVRARFPDVLTTDSLGNSHKVLIYRDKYVEGANSAPVAILEENLMHHLLGFSQIISLLASYHKPIIGHNIFLDVVLMHNQFIGPLPKKYSTFKKNINEIFPIIFDTKHISHEMSKKLTFDEVWKSNALQDLYEFFSEGKCKKLQHGVNLIRLSTPFDVNQSYHEAGWDSYCSGYCFIRLGHWAACENIGKFRPVGPTEKLAALAHYSNKVNIIRGAVPYMNLVGDDPPSHRPDLLHLKCLNERFNIGKVSSVLAAFGSIDIKPYGSRTALIAASSHYAVNNILKQFRDSRDYRISKYSVYRHSVAGRMAIWWGGALLTGSLVIYIIHKKVNNN
ncbi:pre-piRNA 3'-exonuclease trimmer-like [Pectinophora gossypiella]|uniref:pre-piRNA 3'-exonuclease trimmer-like n=1 Tax=Pectinophora gossypiella TaxID=13191 RepID=UPI00214E4F64|nr:pre-piRNA 3'-exonuclease trimmer-like [Pectinophora gossypiella]